MAGMPLLPKLRDGVTGGVNAAAWSKGSSPSIFNHPNATGFEIVREE